MALINEVVNVTITRDTIGITRADFGTILILGDSNSDITEVKTYTSLAEVATDYYDPNDDIAQIEYTMASKIFAQVIKPTKILIAQKQDTDGTLVTAYQRVFLTNGSKFYAVLITSSNIDDIQQIAAIIETQSKIFGIGLNTDQIPVNNNILSVLFEQKYNRSFVINSKDTDNNYPYAAWFGRMLPITPGSATWAYNNLVGVSADNLTSVQRNTIKEQNGNFYASLAGVDVTFEGKMVSGEYIDVIHGLDWLEAYIQENIAALLIAAPKIPYNNNGIGLVENSLRASLQEAVNRGIINENFIIITPDILDVSSIDKASRTLANVKFTAVLTGSIQNIIINGIVTV